MRPYLTLTYKLVKPGVKIGDPSMVCAYKESENMSLSHLQSTGVPSSTTGCLFNGLYCKVFAVIDEPRFSTINFERPPADAFLQARMGSVTTEVSSPPFSFLLFRRFTHDVRIGSATVNSGLLTGTSGIARLYWNTLIHSRLVYQRLRIHGLYTASGASATSLRNFQISVSPSFI